MGLYPQPNKWQCGPFALKHALVMLGKFVDEKEVARIARTHWWAGTDEIKLARAARAYDCMMKVVRKKDALRARRELLRTLKRGHPALLCVDNWSHWITVVGAEKGKIVYIDSSESPVVCVDSWKRLKRRWVYKERDPDDPENIETLYDLHPVSPKTRVMTRARFSLKRARYLRRPENRIFATNWDEYFDDLMRICTPRTPLSANVLPMGELLRRHGTLIKHEIAVLHGGVTVRQIEKVLRNLQFVADTYALVVHRDDEKRAVIAITGILAFWASSKFGVHEVYGNG